MYVVYFSGTSIESLCYISKTFLVDVLKLSIDLVPSYTFGPLVITTVPLLSLYSLEIENQTDRTLNCILKSYCNPQNKIILSITVFKYHVVNAKIIIVALYLKW